MASVSPSVRFLMLAASIVSRGACALGQEVSAVSAAGHQISGRLESGVGNQPVVASENASYALAKLKRIQFPQDSIVLGTTRPARVFHFCDGSRLTGELWAFQNESLTIRAWGADFQVPKASLIAIEQPAGEQQLLFEDFQNTTLHADWKFMGNAEPNFDRTQNNLNVHSGDDLQMLLKLPAVRISLGFLPVRSPATSVNLDLEFGSGANEKTVSIELASSKQNYAVTFPRELRLKTQSIPRENTQTQITILSDQSRFRVLVNEKLLAFGPPLSLPLKSLRVIARNSQPGRPSEKPSLRLFGVQISALEERKRPPLRVSDQDAIDLDAGNQLFGKVDNIDARLLEIESGFGNLGVPWKQIRRVTFAKKPENHSFPAARMQNGTLARIRRKRCADHPYHEGDEFQAVVQSLKAGQLVVQHPLVGEIQFPIAQLNFLELQFTGRTVALLPDVVHLGNQQRADFRRTMPAGTSLEGEFMLSRIPSGSTVLELEVAELEPAGPDTPIASPFLSELRSGDLVTELKINGHRAAHLNDLISQKSKLQTTQSLKVSLPKKWLRAGKNTWQIVQKPLGKNSAEYDDCEIGPIWLLLENEAVATDVEMTED